jgi:hypothetical protein
MNPKTKEIATKNLIKDLIFQSPKVSLSENAKQYMRKKQCPSSIKLRMINGVKRIFSVYLTKSRISQSKKSKINFLFLQLKKLLI